MRSGCKASLTRGLWGLGVWFLHFFDTSFSYPKCWLSEMHRNAGSHFFGIDFLLSFPPVFRPQSTVARGYIRHAGEAPKSCTACRSTSAFTARRVSRVAVLVLFCDVPKDVGVSENSVPINPMVNDHCPY